MASKKIVSVEKKNCIACGTCILACPKDAMNIEKGSYAYAVPEICIGCGICAKDCPTGCISVVTREAVE